MKKLNFNLRISITVPALLSALAGCAGLPRPAPVVAPAPALATKPAKPAAAPAPAVAAAIPATPVAPVATAIPAAPVATAIPAKPAAPVATAIPATPAVPERAPAMPGGGYYKDDGPGDNPPPNLDAIPDAIPKPEPLHRFANRPYVILGQSYTPNIDPHPYREIGAASWYGRRYHGSRTSSGESYDMYAMTAAHRTLPIPSYARITNPANNKAVVVRINDRGPFHNDRLIDVSYTAAYKLGILQNGSSQVLVEALNTGSPTVAQQSLDFKQDMAPAAAPQQANGPQTVTTAPENGGIYVQLGAFSVPENAEQFRTKLGMEQALLAGRLQVMPQGGLFKVRAGPYSSAAEAAQAVEEFRKMLNIKAMVITK